MTFIVSYRKSENNKYQGITFFHISRSCESVIRNLKISVPYVLFNTLIYPTCDSKNIFKLIIRTYFSMEFIVTIHLPELGRDCYTNTTSKKSRDLHKALKVTHSMVGKTITPSHDIPFT